MKKIMLTLTITALILLPWILSSQPAPWDPTIGGGEGNYPVGGGAPLGSGLIMMLALAAGYGARKFSFLKKRSR
ncbi:MAG: hypothetical protein JXA03_05595 [Bacteroidales bacterium]|nr:hypothetical protein [Bacteroidales bacterium]